MVRRTRFFLLNTSKHSPCSWRRDAPININTIDFLRCYISETKIFNGKLHFVSGKNLKVKIFNFEKYEMLRKSFFYFHIFFYQKHRDKNFQKCLTNICIQNIFRGFVLKCYNFGILGFLDFRILGFVFQGLIYMLFYLCVVVL